MTSLAAGRSLDAAAARAYGPYRRRVRANRRRLRRRPRQRLGLKSHETGLIPVDVPNYARA